MSEEKPENKPFVEPKVGRQMLEAWFKHAGYKSSEELRDIHKQEALVGATLFRTGDRVRHKGRLGTIKYIHGGASPEWVTATVQYDGESVSWVVRLEDCELLKSG